MEQIITKHRGKSNLKRWNGKLVRRGSRDFYDVSGTHRERGLTISFHSNNCAPEQFVAHINNRRVRINDPGEYGYLLLTEGPQKIIDKLKHRYRKERKPCAGIVAFGFRFRDNPNSGVYIEHYGSTEDIQSRLRAFKQVRDKFKKEGWRYRRSQTATLGVGYKVESVDENYEAVDPNAPFILHMRQPSSLFEENSR